MRQRYMDAERMGETHINQPVIVPSGVVGSEAEIILCDVFRYYGERDGVTWIGGRQADVMQRYPGYDPSYEWSFVKWSDL